ncbi:MAG: DJ-1 family glyoxalase III [Lentimonas sp.]
MSLRALILLHPGFEEIEAITPIDLLSRADIEVTQATVSEELEVMGRSGITLKATGTLQAVMGDTFDLLIVPGGPGIQKLRGNTAIYELLRRHAEKSKLIGCICAAPLLLKDAGLLGGKNFTAHPSTEVELPEVTEQAVVFDGNLTTSRGAGAATEFALALVQKLCGYRHARQIADSICWPHPLTDISS